MENEDIKPRVFDKNAYYTSKGRKVGDFFIGLIGIWILSSILGAISNLILMTFPGSFPNISPIFSMGFSTFFFIPTILVLILEIVLIVYTFKKGRRFIGIGAIVGLVLPILLALLLLGACLIMFSGGF